MAEMDEREEELATLSAIYPEIIVDPEDTFSATLDLPVAPTKPLIVRFMPYKDSEVAERDSYAQAVTNGAAHIEHDVELSHLPPIHLRVTLPATYPLDAPPTVQLKTAYGWLPKSNLEELEREVENLWEEYGRSQILFAYVDHLQSAAERGFDLEQSSEGCLVLPVTAESDLVLFDAASKQAIFDADTFDCGICLEPKKGSSCYRLDKCGHVFCRQCLQDFYNAAITEGDVAGIKCLNPDCGKADVASKGAKRKRKVVKVLHPRELLMMGVEESMVRRYVEMKRKKKLEADKTTVYCPRTWCQSPAKSPKYPPIPADLQSYVVTESSSGEESGTDTSPGKHESPKPKSVGKVPSDPAERLAVCEKCQFAFCKVCFMGWHGAYARCYPRDPSELSAEEKASYDYIRANTSPCPTCMSPTQKTMGCNHMNCFQCNTHFCYLCTAWLDGQNPYQHFNKAGTDCYQRLWELEEGDEGQRPGDGRGFGGARAWEQLALEAAREADAQEAAVAAAHTDEADRAAEAVVNGVDPQFDADVNALAIAMAQAELDHEDIMEQRAPVAPNARGGRRQRNAFQAPRAAGAANAVRNHERRRRGGGAAVRRLPALNDEERQAQELQRFLELAERDEEDGWNSDELGDDDEGFVIR